LWKYIHAYIEKNKTKQSKTLSETTEKASKYEQKTANGVLKKINH
jgi:hypothetical protein